MRKSYKIESGRSMVEMIAVVAIIGFLSVGVVYGYQYAINLYYAHAITEGAQHRSLIANTQRRIGQNINAQKKDIEEPILEYTVTFDAAFPYGGTTVKKIAISGFNLGVCKYVNEGRSENLKSIKNMTKLPVLINNVDIDGTPVCQDNTSNELVFYIAIPRMSAPRGDSGDSCRCRDLNGDCTNLMFKAKTTGTCCDRTEYVGYCPGEEPPPCVKDDSCSISVTCDETAPENDVCHECVFGNWQLITPDCVVPTPTPTPTPTSTMEPACCAGNICCDDGCLEWNIPECCPAVDCNNNCVTRAELDSGEWFIADDDNPC